MEHDPSLPDDLQPNRQFSRDLARLYRPAGEVDAAADRRIRRRLGHELRPRRGRRLAVTVTAAAAALVLSLGVWRLVEPERDAEPVAKHAARPAAESAAVDGSLEGTPAGAFDVDGSGNVDIVDAYVLARHVARQGGLERRWDANGDGIVDQQDVDAIAQLAVRLR